MAVLFRKKGAKATKLVGNVLKWYFRQSTWIKPSLPVSFEGGRFVVHSLVQKADSQKFYHRRMLISCFTLFSILLHCIQLKWIASPSDDRTSKCNSVTSLLYIMWYQIKYLCILSHVFDKTGNLKILSWAQGSYTGHVYTSIFPLGFFGVPLVTISLFLHFSLVLFLSIQFL